MIIRTTADLAGATLIALAQPATFEEPVLLDDAQLDEITAGTVLHIEITNIVDAAEPGVPIGMSTEPGGDDDGLTGVARVRVAF